MDEGEEKHITAIDWIRERVAKVFRHVPESKFNKAFESAENQTTIEVFLSKADVRVLSFGSNLKASHVLSESGKPGSKGVYFLKPKSMVVRGVYKCPVYKTQHRGPTYVFDAQLRTKQPASRWIMGGVALIMDVVE